MPMHNGHVSKQHNRWDARPRTEQDGDENGGRASPTAIFNPYFTGRPRTPVNVVKREPVDRQEIIRRIKGRESPRHDEYEESSRTQSPPLTPSQIRKSPSPPRLLPSPQLDRPKQAEILRNDAWSSDALSIARPRSALHKGDFRQEKSDIHKQGPSSTEPDQSNVEYRLPLATSPVAPWHRNFPLAASRRASRQIDGSNTGYGGTPARPRAISQASISGSFAYQPPTSPLVHQANAADMPEFDDFQHQNRSPERARRHTFSPRYLRNSLSGSHSVPWLNSSPSTLRREATSPCQAHQPRRSVTSFGSLPQSPMLGSRRSSMSGGSPLQRPMVGSFEESILRGRMSSTPSRPLDFTAQIGVLGKGDCKPSLRCPPHLTVPFPAVFYSYGPNDSTATSSQPSPYVGLVDLETFPEANRARDKSRRRTGHLHKRTAHNLSPASGGDVAEPVLGNPDYHKRRMQKDKRSRSPLVLPKGGYRIPPVGQLQIIIKNPHKTAVKLFLVPYDVSDIQPGQKTFVRQRSYSAGPILDMPLDARKNLGTDRPEAAISATDDVNDKPTLRYLIHLNVCCPSKGRIYLHNCIRVVFANRVPDGKEKLRNEIQLPQPKYSSYRPIKDGQASLSADVHVRHERRRSVVDVAPPMSPMDYSMQMGTSVQAPSSIPHSGSVSHGDEEHHQTSHWARPQSFFFPALDTLESRPTSRGAAEDMDVDRDSRTEPLSPTSRASIFASIRSPSNNDTSEPSTSLTFSRSSSQERPAVRAESLLSRRLKDLEMRAQLK